jgi:RHS repeat-associated protein
LSCRTTTYPLGSTEVLTYDADSNVLTRKTRANQTISFVYDTLNRLITKTPPSPAPVASYRYDLNDRLMGVSDTSAAIAAAVPPSGPSVQYATTAAYDALNRPTGISWNPAPTPAAPAAGSVTFGHAYNKVNQRIGQTATDNSWLNYPAASPSTVSYTPDALNRYTAVGSVTPTYDNNSNLAFDGTFNFGYDAENRLISAVGAGNTAAYTYDAQGRRKTKTVNGTTTVFVTDAGNREVMEYDGASGAILRWYAYGLGSNGVLNQMNVAAASRATFVPDIQGSVIASIDSSSGTLSKIGYLPYGKSAAASGPFGYTGQRIDPETNGLYYYRARHYMPAWGRFLQTDPIGYGGGSNIYAYVNNDPLNNVDPLGLYTLQLGVAVGGTFLGIVVPQAGFGIAIDTSGNVGSYKYVGGGVGISVSAGAGGSVQVSNAQTIYDLSGPFANVGVHGGAGLGGSVDFFTGSSSNGPVFGGGVTFGPSAGAAVSATRTSTQICGLQGCVGNAADLLDVLSFAVTPAAAATLDQSQSMSNANSGSSSSSPSSPGGTSVEAPTSSK